ncbi:hypothetical protein D3C73_1624840 [compost metagenome]
MPSMNDTSERNQSWNKMKAKLLPEKVQDHMSGSSGVSADDERDRDDFIMFYL